MITLPEVFNVASYTADRPVDAGLSKKVAIECGDAVVTYKELQERTNQAGNMLRQLGLALEQRVLLALLDGPDFLYCFLGAIKIGAVAVPVNPLLRAQDYEYLLNDTRARVAILGEAALAEIQKLSRDRLRYVERIVVAGTGSLPVMYMTWLDGVGFRHFGMQGLIWIDAGGSLLVCAAVFLVFAIWGIGMTSSFLAVELSPKAWSDIAS